MNSSSAAPLLLAPALGSCPGLEVAGRETAEQGNWHSCWCSFRSLTLQFQTSMPQHFIIVSYKVLQLSLSILSVLHHFLGRSIGVTPRHIFFFTHSLKLCFFLAKGRQHVLTLLRFQKLCSSAKTPSQYLGLIMTQLSLHLTIDREAYWELDSKIPNVSHRISNTVFPNKSQLLRMS